MRLFISGMTTDESTLVELVYRAERATGRDPGKAINFDVTFEAYSKDHPDLAGSLLMDKYTLQYVDESEDCAVILREGHQNSLLPAFVRSLQFVSNYYVWILIYKEDGQVLPL